MKKFIGFLLFIALVIFLHASCPEKDQHIEALSEDLTQIIGERFGYSGLNDFIGYNPELQSFIKTIGLAIIDVDNYFLFSIGKISLPDKEQVVSFGIAGHVFTFNDRIVQEGSMIIKEGNQALQNIKNKL